MTAPTLLIAEREFRAYTTTASFWVALAVGPIVVAAVLALTGAAGGAPPVPVAVRAQDYTLASSAKAAVAEAGRLEGRRLEPNARGAEFAVVLDRTTNGDLAARFSAGFPLSASGRALVARTIERDDAVRRLASTGVGAPPTIVRDWMPPAARSADPGLMTRFCLVMILWTTLTGSLGMLLQAVVRERANRALEGLLAAARPWEIVFGKLAGVGAVSALVLLSWLGSACGLSALSATRDSFAQTIIGGLGAPVIVARAVAIYVLAFVFYGLVTVAVGAKARDSASAQNLSRPMFAILLAAFFAAISVVVGGGSRLDWLIYVPPFTPFMLLLEAPDRLTHTTQLVALCMMLVTTALAGWFAVSRMTLSGAPNRRLASGFSVGRG